MDGILRPVLPAASYLLLTTSRFKFQNTAVFDFQIQKHGKLFSARRTLLHFWGSWANGKMRCQKRTTCRAITSLNVKDRCRCSHSSTSWFASSRQALPRPELADGRSDYAQMKRVTFCNGFFVSFDNVEFAADCFGCNLQGYHSTGTFIVFAALQTQDVHLVKLKQSCTNCFHKNGFLFTRWSPFTMT